MWAVKCGMWVLGCEIGLGLGFKLGVGLVMCQTIVDFWHINFSQAKSNANKLK